MKQVLNVNGVTITVEAASPSEKEDEKDEGIRQRLKDALDVSCEDVFTDDRLVWWVSALESLFHNVKMALDLETDKPSEVLDTINNLVDMRDSLQKQVEDLEKKVAAAKAKQELVGFTDDWVHPPSIKRSEVAKLRAGMGKYVSFQRDMAEALGMDAPSDQEMVDKARGLLPKTPGGRSGFGVYDGDGTLVASATTVEPAIMAARERAMRDNATYYVKCNVTLGTLYDATPDGKVK